MTRKDILTIVANDQWMMDVLNAAQTLDMPDWWMGRDLSEIKSGIFYTIIQ